MNIREERYVSQIVKNPIPHPLPSSTSPFSASTPKPNPILVTHADVKRMQTSNARCPICTQSHQTGRAKVRDKVRTRVKARARVRIEAKARARVKT